MQTVFFPLFFAASFNPQGLENPPNWDPISQERAAAQKIEESVRTTALLRDRFLAVFFAPTAKEKAQLAIEEAQRAVKNELGHMASSVARDMVRGDSLSSAFTNATSSGGEFHAGKNDAPGSVRLSGLGVAWQVDEANRLELGLSGGLTGSLADLRFAPKAELTFSTTSRSDGEARSDIFGAYAKLREVPLTGITDIGHPITEYGVSFQHRWNTQAGDVFSVGFTLAKPDGSPAGESDRPFGRVEAFYEGDLGGGHMRAGLFAEREPASRTPGRPTTVGIRIQWSAAEEFPRNALNT